MPRCAWPTTNSGRKKETKKAETRSSAIKYEKNKHDNIKSSTGVQMKNGYQKHHIPVKLESRVFFTLPEEK